MRLIKRGMMSPKENALYILSIIMITFMLITGMLMLLRVSPISVYVSLLTGSLKTTYRIKETLNLASLFTIASLGTAFALSMRFMSVGGEGQIVMGGVFATFGAIYLNHLPAIMLIPFMIVFAFIGGGIWALIATFIKMKYQVNETIVTLMMNYIAIQIVVILQQGIWKDPASLGYPKIIKFTKNAVLPTILSIPTSWIIAILLFGLSVYVMYYSKLGYEMRVLGQSEASAKYAGMNISKVMLLVMLLSGGFCGLVGFIQVSSHIGTLNPQVGAGIGFTAVMIAWIAKLKPSYIVLTSICFAVLQQGAIYMESTLNISSSISLMIQGVILFSVLGSSLFKEYRLVRVGG